MQDKQLRKGLGESETRLQRFNRRAKATGAALASFGVTAGIAAGGGLLALAKSTAAAGDVIQKMGIRTGASAEFLSTMAFAAEQSGTDINKLGDALFRMNRRVAEATEGSGEAAGALAKLGLSAERLNVLTTEQKFFEIVRALQGVENSGERAALSFDLFGRQAQDLLPLLESGEAGIRALQQEAVSLGRQMSQENVDAAAAFSDTLNELNSSLKGLGQTLGFAVLPLMTELVDKFHDGIRFAGEFLGLLDPEKFTPIVPGQGILRPGAENQTPLILRRPPGQPKIRPDQVPDIADGLDAIGDIGAAQLNRGDFDFSGNSMVGDVVGKLDTLITEVKNVSRNVENGLLVS